MTAGESPDCNFTGANCLKFAELQLISRYLNVGLSGKPSIDLLVITKILRSDPIHGTAANAAAVNSECTIRAFGCRSHRIALTSPALHCGSMGTITAPKLRTPQNAATQSIPLGTYIATISPA